MGIRNLKSSVEVECALHRWIILSKLDDYSRLL